MRAAPAFHVVLTRFGLWQAAVVVLTAATVACIVACVTTQVEAPSAAMWLAAAAGVSAASLMGASLVRPTPVGLRWDGERWHLGARASVGDEERAGNLMVAVDLGGWLLLRFVPEAPSRPLAATWLPVQRRGLEGAWHGLRCAVYSPRSSSGQDALADQ